MGRHVDAVVAAPRDRERGGGRVELDGPARVERAQVQRDVTGGDLELQEVALVVLDAARAVAPAAHEPAGVDLDLQVAAVAGVELVARGQWRVDLGGGPGGAPRARETHRARRVTGPR